MDIHGIAKELLYFCQYCNFQTDTLEAREVHLEKMHYGSGEVSESPIMKVENEKFSHENLYFQETKLNDGCWEVVDHNKFELVESYENGDANKTREKEAYKIGEFESEINGKSKVVLGGYHAAELEYCDVKLSDNTSLTEHTNKIKRKQSDGTNVCQHCDLKAVEKHILTKHMKEEHSKFLSSCPFCSHKATQLGNLRTYMIRMHSDINMKDKPILCQYCEFATTEQYLMKRHVKSDHPELLYACLFCPHKATQPGNLNTHMNLKHSDQNMDNPNACQYCKFRSKEKCLMKKHVKEKHPQFLFSCPHCPHKATQAGNLKTHINSKHTKEVLFKCDYCLFETTTKPLLDSHVNSKHTLENLYNCPNCEYVARRPGSLKNHIEVKHELRRYQCNYCENSFTKSAVLLAHIESFHKDACKEIL